MPQTALKHLAKKAGISPEKADHYWNKAKGIVKAEYHVDEHDGKFWALTMGIAKKMMGLKESVTFRQFLEAAVTREPAFEIKGAEEAMTIIATHCKDAHWMMEENRPLYRGQKNLSDTIRAAGYVAVDTAATERRSENTSNYYTMILDNNPAMKGFPKRARSFIGSTDKMTASSFARSWDDEGGKTYAMIPYDGVKIGVCPRGDMWNNTVELLDVHRDIADMNDSFEFCGLKPTLESFKEFDEALRDGDENALKRFKKIFHNAFTEGKTDDFLNNVWYAYRPSVLGLTACTTKTLPHELRNKEVWVGGKVLLVDLRVWTELVEQFKP
jgi:hypothetical protein